jgi:tripartite-type tricarboxylate transporter receptor subunit TctC
LEKYMKLARRILVQLVAGAALLSAATHDGMAQAYPSRPIRILVGFPPGGVGDILARLIGQWLSDRFGKPVVIENRPGAAGNIAAEAVANAAADGYTLLAVGVNHAINASVYKKLKFNFIRDFSPIAGIMRVPNVMVVHPSFPAKSVPEFIAYAKANPGTINMASAGNGTSAHVTGELFQMMAGVKLVHVPYRGGAPAVADLLGGHVQVLFSVVAESIEHISAGRLRALAVTTATRLAVLPDTPTIAEFLPGYESSGWQGIAAPRNTPGEIIETLNKEINEGLADGKIKSRIEALGGTVLAVSPTDFARLIASETDKWRKVVEAANIKPR